MYVPNTWRAVPSPGEGGVMCGERGCGMYLHLVREV